MATAEIDLSGRLTTPTGRQYRMAGVARTGRHYMCQGGTWADVRWFEPVALPPEPAMQTCADLAPDGWVCEEHGAKGVAGCQGPWMPGESGR